MRPEKPAINPNQESTRKENNMPVNIQPPYPPPPQNITQPSPGKYKNGYTA